MEYISHKKMVVEDREHREEKKCIYIFRPTPEQIPSNTEYKVFHFQIRISNGNLSN